jgi:hypothetical protein
MNRLLRRWIFVIVGLVFRQCAGTAVRKPAGVHVIIVTLKPGATMDQFVNFYVHEVLPEYEKHWPGLKGYLLKAFFADSKNKFAVVWLFKTVEDRNRNFDADGQANELEKAALEKVKPIEEKLKNTYGSYTVQYTHEDDWVVQ